MTCEMSGRGARVGVNVYGLRVPVTAAAGIPRVPQPTFAISVALSEDGAAAVDAP